MNFQLYRIGICLILMLFCSKKSFSQLVDVEGVPVLSIDFFKGTPKADSEYASKIYIHHKYFYTVREHNDDGTVFLDVKIKVIPDSVNSYFDHSRVKEAEIADLINHERGHLIIGCLIGNLLTSALNSLAYTNDYKQEIKTQFEACYHKYDRMQIQYDEETDHGSKKNIQARWDEKLRTLLKETTIEPK